VNVKSWNVFLVDDGLEENHETFSITLKNPQNTILGQRNSASVKTCFFSVNLCPDLCLTGRCDPEDLKVASPPFLPDPSSPRPEDEDPVTDIEAELLWETQPDPPRGDVPDHRPQLDYEEMEPQDQMMPVYRRIHTSKGHLVESHLGSTSWNPEGRKVGFTKKI
ncbi:hypothetical protein XENOCAPTIV_027919, partial [Xenoophorus captivus]